MSLLRIWITDDSRESALLLSTAIRESFGEVEVVHLVSGLELLKALADHPPPDYLFLDVHMPEISGLAAMQLIQERGQKPACVILCSSDKNPGLPDLAKEAGADSFFYKPWGFDELVKTVLDVLSQ